MSVIIWLFFGVLTSMVASGKGYNGLLAFIGGVLFGPLGLIYYVCKSNPKKEIEHFIIVHGREAYQEKLREEERIRAERYPSVVRWRCGVIAFIAIIAGIVAHTHGII